jgi:putative membrane protein
MPSRAKKFLANWFINTLAVLVAVYMVPGIRFSDNRILTPFITSLVLGVLNAFIRPILQLVTFPLMILTLGLFRLVINAVLLYAVGLLLSRYFLVENFWSAFLGALVISIVSLVLNTLTGNSSGKIKIQRSRPPEDSGPGGQGPVIDV